MSFFAQIGHVTSDNSGLKKRSAPTATHCNTLYHAATHRATQCKKARKERSAHKS